MRNTVMAARLSAGWVGKNVSFSWSNPAGSATGVLSDYEINKDYVTVYVGGRSVRVPPSTKISAEGE